ncbi:hypothetical protein A2765_06360 [Candidatus Kaiserbacteria bacterium RIFCSPHIGHO2_01_FULL_56_24]|uniref:Lysine transporter LysE n=1 Tax=Candidatus Kaiserbacteria bacterium RIFCSPHIGHO2_01_FULL_56_24 TaxID=1798487 RepID=A0A1F6DFY2_9BACT|nr:MAG: hypothetical protein A2765_06360 [Candidatus Kaiserbacteria bacterium RIFCSPHIGHO2_01_FULL_56_24]
MYILLQALTLGIVGGLIPGPILTLLLISVLQGGLSAGIRAFVWAMLSEVVIAGGFLLIATQLSLSDTVFAVIGLVGGLVLLHFSYRVFQLRSVTVQNGEIIFTPTKIFIISGTNATLYIFWITVCFPLIWQLGATWGLVEAAVSYFLAFEFGWGSATFCMMLIFLFARATLTNERIMHKVYIFLSLVLAAFGLNMLIRAILILT